MQKTEKKIETSELIADEDLNKQEAEQYITYSLEHGFASDKGMGLQNILPKKRSLLDPEYFTMRNSVFKKISNLVEKFKGIH